jgi:hypothetical protein
MNLLHILVERVVSSRDILVTKTFVGNNKIADAIIEQSVEMIQMEKVSNLNDLSDNVIPYLRSMIDEHSDEWKIENFKVQANTINNPNPKTLPLVMEIQYKREMGAYPTILLFTIKEMIDEPSSDHDRFAAWKR